MSDSSQPLDTTGGAPSPDITRGDEWIRDHVGRRILIGCAGDLPDQVSALLTRYQEMRLAPLPPARDSELEIALHALLPMDPHALLFWLDSSSGDISEAAGRLYHVCERTGALDVCFVALVGPRVSRADARSLTFEDGFAWPGDASRLIETLLTQAEAREEARCRGSSPPCYL